MSMNEEEPLREENQRLQIGGLNYSSTDRALCSTISTDQDAGKKGENS